MKKHIRSVIVFVVIALLAFFAYRTFGNGKETVETLVVHLAPFLQQVSVSGTVVAREEVELGFTQSGRIASVSATVGEHVARGTLIASLENGDLSATVSQKEAQVGKARAKLAQMVTGTRPEDIAVSLSEVASNETAHEQSKESVLNALRDAYAKADDAVHNKVDQFLDNPRSANPKLKFATVDVQYETAFYAKRRSAESMLSTWKGDLSTLSVESDLLKASNLAQADLQEIIGLINDANVLLNRASPTATITQTTLSGWITDLATSRTNLNTSSASITTAITTERAAATKLETSKKSLALKEAGSTKDDIDAAEAELSSAEADLESARAQYAKTIIVAPFAGTITRMDGKVGAIASPNVSQMGIISDGILHVESYVPEINIALISLGDKATVSLDAYGDDVLFPASVISIDPARTLRDGVSAFKTTLSFGKLDPRLRSGMTANVVVTTEEKDSVVSIPQRLVVSRGGRKYVTVRENGKAEDREVTIGTVSTLGTIEIKSGLSEGDVIVISPKP